MESLEELRSTGTSSPAAVGIATNARYTIPAHVAHLNRTIVAAVESGRGRLIVSEPPRHGKSELLSHFTPVWFLERWPWKHVLAASHTADLAHTWGRAVRNTIEGHQGLLTVRIAGDSSAAHRWNTTAGGGMRAVGIGGAIHGKGGDLLVVDDPYPTREKANSKIYRDKVWSWFREDAYSRLAPENAVVLIMTRFHEDDLVGRLTGGAAASDADDEFFNEVPPAEWTVINLPALAQEDDPLGRAPGEALWPGRFPRPWLIQQRREMGSSAFEALYQGNPTPAGGAVFAQKHFRTWRKDGHDHVILEGPDGIVSRWFWPELWIAQTCDTAMKEKQDSDWTVVLTFAVTPRADLLLLDVARDRLEVPDQWGYVMRQRAIWQKRGNWRWQGTEDKGSGVALLQLADRAGVPMKALEAIKDKLTRAAAASVFYEMGKVYHPTDAHWLACFEAELLGFPNAAHDDQVDTVGYAVRAVRNPRRMALPKPEEERDRANPLEQNALLGGGPETW